MDVLELLNAIHWINFIHTTFFLNYYLGTYLILKIIGYFFFMSNPRGATLFLYQILTNP